MLSDNFLVNNEITLKKSPVSAKTVSYRKYRSIDKADLKTTCLVLDPPQYLDHMVDLYSSILMDLVEGYAPLRTKQMSQRALLHWYNKEIQAAKRHRRYCECLWIRTGLSVHYEIFKLARLVF